jgi:U4/U6.U5 tri-snRNP component SNU23
MWPLASLRCNGKSERTMVSTRSQLGQRAAAHLHTGDCGHLALTYCWLSGLSPVLYALCACPFVRPARFYVIRGGRDISAESAVTGLWCSPSRCSARSTTVYRYMRSPIAQWQFLVRERNCKHLADEHLADEGDVRLNCRRGKSSKLPSNGMSKKTSTAIVDNTARRTWDKEEFAHTAAEKAAKHETEKDDSIAEAKRRRRWERDPLHQGLIVERSALKSREFDLDLTSRLGKTQVIGLNTPLSQQAGYYCSVCDCILRDSQSYLDHINGKWHNRALGMNMKPERATLLQVRERMAAMKEKKGQSKEEDYLPDGIDRRILEAEEEEEREREDRRERRRAKKRSKEDSEPEEDGGMDPDMQALMGFGGFGSSKK